jgi:hypothetical protein
MSVGHEAGFELLSVRTGLGERLPYRCGGGPAPDFSAEGVKKETRELLERLRGDDGRRVRANVERLGNTLQTSWEDGGAARVNLEEFWRSLR